jgi:CubicO group peptidase (beta-lactamase class C family)
VASTSVHGITVPDFEPVRVAYEALVESETDCAGQLCVYVDGKRVVDLWAGVDLTPDDLFPVFSTSKGMGGVCIARLVEAGVIDLDEPVSRYWPEFAAGGKDVVSVRMALSHQAGVPGVEPQLVLNELLDHPHLAARVAQQIPHWYPGAAHGYHSFTLGTIIDELVRRTTNSTVAEYFVQEIAEPYGIDARIGTVDADESRVRLVEPPTGAESSTGVTPDAPDSLIGMVFNEASGDRGLLPDVGQPFGNVRDVRRAGNPACSGVASARGLARLYALCLGPVGTATPLLSAQTVARVAQIQSIGLDLILQRHNRNGVVFQKSDNRLRYGSHQAFGHDGAGGSIAFADPWYGLSFGWIPRRMPTEGGADERGLELAALARRCIQGR